MTLCVVAHSASQLPSRNGRGQVGKGCSGQQFLPTLILWLGSIHLSSPHFRKRHRGLIGKDPDRLGEGDRTSEVARRDGQRFHSAIWLHKARELLKEEFKREVSKHLTGNETEPWEILYFKACKSQLPVIEQTLETAGLMLGSDKSRGYCLEMICADFLAGANLDTDNSDALLISLDRLFDSLPQPKKQEFFDKARMSL